MYFLPSGQIPAIKPFNRFARINCKLVSDGRGSRCGCGTWCSSRGLARGQAHLPVSGPVGRGQDGVGRGYDFPAGGHATEVPTLIVKGSVESSLQRSVSILQSHDVLSLLQNLVLNHRSPKYRYIVVLNIVYFRLVNIDT